MTDELARLPFLLTSHVQLSLAALAIGTITSVPLGIWLTRRERPERLVLAVASVVQTIPSLALLAIMVPLLAAVGVATAWFGVELRSIGFLPALIGLSLYSVLPILRNTVIGIRGVDPALTEAALGVGMTDAQRLRLVELPLALPVIVAGLRTSAVWVVGTATLSTPVGAPSLGNFIFSGLQTRNLTAVLVGCVAAAALALLLDGLIALLERGVRTGNRLRIMTGIAGLGLLVAYAVAAFGASVFERDRSVTIGAKTFTEQYVLAEILSGTIERHADRPTRTISSLGSTVAFDALRTGQIDVYVDYTGTIWATIMKRDQPRTGREDVREAVEAHLAREHGIDVIAVLGFENAYALAMRREHAEQLDVGTIGELTPHTTRMEIGGDYEFFSRPEWRSIRETYDLRFRNRRSMDSSLMYQAVAGEQVDVISAFSTDGRIDAFDLKVLEDDRGAIPPYDAVILGRPGLARDMPAVVRAIRTLDGVIDAETMRRMNWEVDEKGRSPESVAREFLREKGV